jgi:four helix bundle protein
MNDATSPLLQKTKQFALEVIGFLPEIPNSFAGKVIAQQLVRAATSVGSNYRATRRSRSKAEFIAKLGLVLEEIDESVFWLEILQESKTWVSPKVRLASEHASEISAMVYSARRTALAKVEKSGDTKPPLSKSAGPFSRSGATSRR